LSAHFNQLTSINISQSANLYDLGLGVNNLTNIDLTQNTGLIYFSCSSNNLTNLDLTQNTALEELICVDNNLTSLDVTQNTNLRRLLAYENISLLSLDIRNGNNEAIEQFDATNANLQCIYVDDASASYLENWLIDPNSTFANNEQECEVLSNNHFSKDYFTLYPNPAKEFITVIAKAPANFTLSTAQGNILTTDEIRQGLNRLNLSNLSSGLYFLKVYSKDGETTKKIIKK
jgi:hypothetical protein